MATITIGRTGGSALTREHGGIVAGILTGQIGGLIMAAVLMVVFTIFLNQPVLYPVQVIGSAILGERALVGFNLTAIILGLVIHQLGPALFWGLIFGYLAEYADVRTTQFALVLGVLIGVVSMIVDVYLLVPAYFNSVHGNDIWAHEVPLSWDWIAHIAYGLSFGFYPRILARISR